MRISAQLPIGTRFERTRTVMLQLEEMVRADVPEAVNVTTQVGGGRGPFGGASSHRGSMTVTLVEKVDRQRTSNQIAMALPPLAEPAARRRHQGAGLRREPG